MKRIKYIALYVKKYLTGFLHLVYPKICLHCGSTDLIKFQVLCPNCYAQLPFTDFFEIEKGKSLKTNVPIHIEGTAKGVKEGGILDQRLHELEAALIRRAAPTARIIAAPYPEGGLGSAIADRLRRAAATPQ